MKNIVVLTGAGISAESGIKTFREGNGLWEEYDVMDVASIDGWNRNQSLVLDFYNARRKQLLECEPNKAHYALVELEKYFNVHVVTQNVDDLHERAGSTNILHLHGELKKVRSTVDPNLIYELDGWELKLGDKCPKGSQLRPHIVWFGEAVPMIDEAIKLVKNADIVVIIGTSLNVYPAAGLVDYSHQSVPKYLIDPNGCNVSGIRNITVIKERATVGVEMLKELLLK